MFCIPECLPSLQHEIVAESDTTPTESTHSAKCNPYDQVLLHFFSFALI